MTPGPDNVGRYDADAHVRSELGAYVLGALEPAERRQVDRHLEDCASCRDELGRLSVLPPLLDRLSPEEAATDYGEVERRLTRVLAASSAEEHRRLQRQIGRWRAAAALAAAVAVGVALFGWQPWRQAPDRIVVQVQPASQQAQPVQGTVAAYAWEWGTTVEIRVDDLPPARHYEIWAVGEDGRRERAGTWGPTAHGGATVRGASAIQRHQLARIEVTDPSGTTLFAASFDHDTDP